MSERSQAAGDVFLPTSGLAAGWRPDPYRPDAVVLTVGGAEQSTLVPGSPTRLVYEYLQRVANVLDVVPDLSAHRLSRPAAVAHLGGGALSLTRRLELTHPGLRQVVVDLDRELMAFVLGSFPLAEPALTRIVAGDVQHTLGDIAEDGPFAAVVLDIALDQYSPERLLSADYLRGLLDLTTPDGAVIVNIGDDGGLPATTRLVAAACQAGASVFVTAPSDVLSGDYTGNVILVASRHAWSRPRLEQVVAAGPHPASVVAGPELSFLGR
jgi:spermidine synthase